jgi:pimeloyl-ACP methyl ester carboxylesterase
MFAIALIGLIAVAAGYSNVKSMVDARRYPAPGTMVDIGGHRLHLHCEGAGPTVILDAGAGTWSIMMGRLQKQLRDSVRACAFDRTGLGWSESSGGGADVGTAADELRKLIEVSGLPRPVVLVGHSLGANIAQVYASRYASDLAGVVLLDPGRHDDMLEDFTRGDSAALAISGCGWKCGLASGAAWLGVPRLAARNAGKKNFTPEEAEVYRAWLVRPAAVSRTIATLEYLPMSGVQTRAARSFGTTPVTIMYSQDTRQPTGDETPADVVAWHAATLDSMRAILQGTTQPNGPVILPGVTHTTMVLQPDAIRSISSEVLRLTRLPR